MVKELLIKDQRVIGIKTGMGLEIKAKSVVLTNGTFLNGIIHIGEKKFGGGIRTPFMLYTWKEAGTRNYSKRKKYVLYIFTNRLS